MKFRERKPVRREDPKKCADYHDYRASLKDDFHGRCGYCDDSDRFSDVQYQIDHFVPKAVMTSIADNDYGNLVYACRRCNRAKWDKWPTGDENSPNDGAVGFIDPCDSKYDQQFIRNERGEIIPLTALGNWMWNEMDLGNPAHRIIWMLTQIRKEMETISSHAQEGADAKMALLCNKYFTLEDQLKGSPHF